MERLIFDWGACLMGLFCLISMLAVYNSNKRVLKDLKQPGEEKDKWLKSFMAEHQKLQKENTKIHNPSVYVVKRMRGRKIGPWSIRQMKSISWGTFILSFLFAGLQILWLRFPFLEKKYRYLPFPWWRESVQKSFFWECVWFWGWDIRKR